MNFNLTNVPRKLLPTVKSNLREKVPKLNERQLKRLSMTPIDALVDELKEFRKFKALEVFQKILQIDQSRGKSFEKSQNQKLLKKIVHSLKKIDLKSNEAEIELLLDLINEIWDVSEEFDWLIELLLVHSSELILEFNLEDRKIDAIVKFTHACALSERLQWYRPAVILFESAFQLASFHEEWTLNSDQLCVMISHQLSDCLTKLSSEVREKEKDVNGALILSRRSLKVVRKFFSPKSVNYEINAEYEYGICHFEKENYKNALEHLGHALALAVVAKLKKKYCEILVKIAECHRK